MTKPGISAERVEELKQYLDASWHSALAVLGVNHPDGQRLGQIHCDLLALLDAHAASLQAGPAVQPEGEDEDLAEWIDIEIDWAKKQFSKPRHGTCCTCQTCGGSNEEPCLCDRIQTLQALKARLSAPAKEGK